MQVKKFEAKTIGEALELVKHSFGPEAVILSTKDNSKRFGIAGSQSVEITAAISEDTLNKKHYADKILNEKNKSLYSAMSAKGQKEFINKSIARFEAPEEKKEITSKRYIDIDDDHATEHLEANAHYYGQNKQQSQSVQPKRQASQQQYANVNNDFSFLNEAANAEQRIKSAASRAFEAASGSGTLFFDEPATSAPASKRQTTPAVQNTQKDVEINSLRNEITVLKEMVSKFNSVPQNFISLHPGAEENVPFEFSILYQKLLNSGLEKDLINQIVGMGKKELTPDMKKKPGIIDGWCAQHILKSTKIFDQKNSKKFQFFVGPNGQGKTSSLVKLASQYVVYNKKRVAIITTDTKKVGAVEQLRIFSKILNVAFGVVKNQDDWDRILPKLAGFDYVLVDTLGSQLRETSDFDLVRSLIPKGKVDHQIHYVQSVLSNSESSQKTVEAYKMLGITDAIFTHLDEPAQFGSVYNFQRRFDIPLHSFSIGPAIPEDYEFATKERVLDLIFNITNVAKGARSHG